MCQDAALPGEAHLHFGTDPAKISLENGSELNWSSEAELWKPQWQFYKNHKSLLRLTDHGFTFHLLLLLLTQFLLLVQIFARHVPCLEHLYCARFPVAQQPFIALLYIMAPINATFRSNSHLSIVLIFYSHYRIYLKINWLSLNPLMDAHCGKQVSVVLATHPYAVPCEQTTSLSAGVH